MLATVLTASLAALMVYFAWPALWRNTSRPLLPSPGGSSILARSTDAILFASRPYLWSPYQEAMNYIALRKDSQIGLLMNLNDWEYPLWRGLRRSGIAQLRIEHVGLPHPDLSRPYPLGPFNPTLLIVTTKPLSPALTIDGNLWHRKLLFPSLAIYTREP